MKTNNTIINSIMRTYMKYICAVLMVLGMSVNAWALHGYETIIWSEQGLSEGEAVSTSTPYSIGTYFQVTCAQMSGSNKPKYYAANNGLRCYVPGNSTYGNKFTVSLTAAGTAAGVKILKVVYNATHGYSRTTYFTYSPTPASSTTTSATYNFSSSVTTAYAQVSTEASNAAQCSLHSITVYYGDEDITSGPSIEVLNSDNIPVSNYSFGTTDVTSGNATFKVNGLCLEDYGSYGYYMVASFSEGGEYFSVSDYYLENLNNNSLTISYSVAGNGTYNGNLNIWGWIGYGCPGYGYGGETVEINIPFTVTIAGACTDRSITMSNFSKDYGAADFVPTHTVSAGSGTKTWTSGTASVATIVDGKVHIVGAGTSTITLNVAASGDYCAVSKSCTMTVNAVAPTVTNFTASCTNNKITVTNANASTVSNKGGASITRYGYLYSTSVATPTFGASGVYDANVGTSDVTLNARWAAKEITGLSAGTTYYVRAYAYNGTAYGYSSVVTITTKCAVTYAANGGTGSTTDASSPYEKLSDVTVLANGFTPPTGKKFVDWLGSDANHYAPGDVINDISTDMTLTAQWTDITYEKYVFACVDISVASAAAGKALVTSRYEAAKNINVMATNPIKVTVSGAVAGHRVTFTNSVGLHFYKKVEGTGDDVGKYKYIEATGANSFVTPLTNQEVYVSYQPTSAGTGAVLSELPFTISCDGESQEFNTAGQYIQARNLPEKVAIVANAGNTWMALPTPSSASTPEGTVVSVSDGTAAGPANVAYKLWPVKTVSGNHDRFGTYQFSTTYYGDRLRFAAVCNGNKALWANNSSSTTISTTTTITAISDGSDDAPASNEWQVETSIVDGQFVYKLKATQASNTNYLRYKLGADGGPKWGTYANGDIVDLYILPLTEVTEADIKVMEWGTNNIAVSYPNRASCTAMTAKIGTGSPAAVTINAIGGDLYELTGVGDLQSNPGKSLALAVTEGSAKQKTFLIPYIATSSVAEATIRTAAGGDNAAKMIDVVIRSGGTLTTGTASGIFNDLYIYPGGKADITNTIGLNHVYMRGGFSWLGGDYAHPQLKMTNGKTISGIGNAGCGIFYDIYLDNSMYYMFALPKDVPVGNITNEENGDDWDAWIKSYSGEGRTKSPKESGWSYVTSGSIARGAGYEIAIKPRLSRPYGILRFPLLKATSWSDETDPTPTIKGWGANNASVSDNNKGWNCIGNPYLTAYNNAALPGTTPSEKIQTKTFVQEIVAGNWTGKYIWSDSDVKYFTIPRFTEYEYDDVRAWPYKLEPFFPFFIQATGDGTISFSGSNKALKMPSFYAEQTAREVFVDFQLQNAEGKTDVAGLTISDQYSDAFDMNDKEKTIQNGNNSMKVYTLVGEYRTAFNALTEATAALPIPVGIIAPTAGTYRFAKLEDADYSEVEHLWLTDYTQSSLVDLLVEPFYEFTTEAGRFEDRFAINATLAPKQDTPTDIDGTSEEIDQPIKFIYHDKMYIMRGGVIYDATGKRVREINK